MHIVRTVQEMVELRSSWIKQVGFVPTMGYLHQGHLSLCQQARAENERVVVSIFINPTQFGPHEDLNRYPRDLERDLTLLEAQHIDAVFLPTAQDMYPSGFTTYVDPQGPLSTEGEGRLRPGHFRGVATVVLKLFQIVRPLRAYFGQKDAQQVAVLTRMVTDFNLPLTLCIQPTIREVDGLAMSSRNSYLDPVARNAATILYRALQAGRSAFDELAKIDNGENSLSLRHSQSDISSPGVTKVIQVMQEMVAHEPLVQLDYAELRDTLTFLPLPRLQAPALLLIAAQLGSTRLIDNFILHSDYTWDTGVIVKEG